MAGARGRGVVRSRWGRRCRGKGEQRCEAARREGGWLRRRRGKDRQMREGAGRTRLCLVSHTPLLPPPSCPLPPCLHLPPLTSPHLLAHLPAGFLQGKPYHISALYLVDLKRFRALAAGDQLRCGGGRGREGGRGTGGEGQQVWSAGCKGRHSKQGGTQRRQAGWAGKGGHPQV